MELPSTKPYLIRAIHEWCCDNNFTPYISVIAGKQARIPREFVRDGKIVLNIGYEATGHLNIANDGITFQARFGGVARDIAVPMGNVAAVYAKENGTGMAFEPSSEDLSDEGKDPVPDVTQVSEPEPPAAPPTGRPSLTRIK